MKPWDSARALQVCGQNHDKYHFGGNFVFLGLHLVGVVDNFSGDGGHSRFSSELHLMSDAFVKKKCLIE